VSDVIDWTTRWSTECARPRSTNVWRLLGRLIALAFIVDGIVQGPLRFGWHGRPLTVAILTAVCAAAWIVSSCGLYMAPGRIGERAMTGSLVVLGTVGAVLTGLDPRSAAAVFPAAAALSIAIRFRGLRALACVAVLSAILLVTAAAAGGLGSGLGYVSLLFGIYGLGIGRRSQVLRTETAEQLLAETRRANAEEAHAAALAERSRIAREIHDVLAHSLAALTVQLEAADALLTNGTNIAKAHNYVITARRIAREGLTETRRAIAALREDTPPLRTLLHALAEAHDHSHRRLRTRRLAARRRTRAVPHRPGIADQRTQARAQRARRAVTELHHVRH
jgi:signal transduction histidine kinase